MRTSSSPRSGGSRTRRRPPTASIVPARPLHEVHGATWTQEGAQEAATGRLEATLEILRQEGLEADRRDRRLHPGQRHPRRADGLRRRPDRDLHAPGGPLPLAAQGRGAAGAEKFGLPVKHVVSHVPRREGARSGVAGGAAGRLRPTRRCPNLRDPAAGSGVPIPRPGHPARRLVAHESWIASSRAAARAAELGPPAPVTHAARPAGGGRPRVRRAAAVLVLPVLLARGRWRC